MRWKNEAKAKKTHDHRIELKMNENEEIWYA